MALFHQFVCRTAQKRIGAAALVSATLAALAVWLLCTDQIALRSDERLREALRLIEVRLDRLQARVDALAVDVAAREQVVMSSERRLRDARQLQSTWDWFGVNHAQQRANRARLERMQRDHAGEERRLGELKRQLARLQWGQAGAQLERDRLQEQLQATAGQPASAAPTFARIWLRLRGWLLLGVAVYLLGPVLAPLLWHRVRALSL